MAPPLQLHLRFEANNWDCDGYSEFKRCDYEESRVDLGDLEIAQPPREATRCLACLAAVADAYTRSRPERYSVSLSEAEQSCTVSCKLAME